MKKSFPMFLHPLLLGAFAALSQAQQPFAADLYSSDGVTLSVTLDPPEINPARDALLILTLTTPAGVEAVLPSLLEFRDRFRGFSRVEDFSKEPVTTADTTRREIHWLLTPEPVPENGYVLRPFAVELRMKNEELRMNASPSIPNSSFLIPNSSFATRPVVFPAAPLPEFVTGEIVADLKPLYIPPPPRTLLLYALITLGGLALLALLLYALRHVRRVVREHRMSPGERAYAELDRLLQRGYIQRGLYKDFYIELTHVVRRYIQRAHGIHAPVQTTEEFLRAATRHPRFQGETLQRLRDFLESADLVKFAGAAATPDLADSSTSAARRYIEADTLGTCSKSRE